MKLRIADLSEKRKIYEWLACSDITPSVMGPPNFEDHPVLSWEEFDRDYQSVYFGNGTDLEGKCFIIEDDDKEIGVICHNQIKLEERESELDIWLKSESVCGKGYGTRALLLLVRSLNKKHNVKKFVIRPSGRNRRAIASYQKAGFVLLEQPPKKYFDPYELYYDDCVVLVKELEGDA